MTSEKKCCVPNCASEKEILHKFPNPERDPERFQNWIYNIGGDILALDNHTIFKRRRICRMHFETRYHTRSKFLSADAVPRLCIPESFIGRPSLMDVRKQGNGSTSAVLPPQDVSPAQSTSCNKRRKHQVLHTFLNPLKGKDRFETWIKCIGGNILGLDYAHIHKYRQVCHVHFEAKYLCRYNRISKDAIPTIIISDFDFIKCKRHKEHVIDFMINLSCRVFVHNYCRNVNKILSGRKTCDDNKDELHLNAKKYTNV